MTLRRSFTPPFLVPLLLVVWFFAANCPLVCEVAGWTSRQHECCGDSKGDLGGHDCCSPVIAESGAVSLLHSAAKLDRSSWPSAPHALLLFKASQLVIDGSLFGSGPPAVARDRLGGSPPHRYILTSLRIAPNAPPVPA